MLSQLSLTGASWSLQPAEASHVHSLARSLHVSPVVARCMILRGIDDAQAGQRLLNPDLDALHDPHAMFGMGVAVERLRRALRDEESIRVVTDYDVDGTTSSLLLQATLRLLGCERLSYHIPDRMDEGYGFSVRAAERAAAEGISLIITADIGVKDHAAVTRARELGVDVIVCDHHLPPGEDVPADATAVLCPPQVRCSYPNVALAACGVSLKLAQAMLADHRSYEQVVRSMLKLAAIGTVADVVDLFTEENRAIVSLGLDSLNAGRHAPGLQALLDVSQATPGQIRASDLGFRIGPRINAAGRLASASAVVELMNTRDPGRAYNLARELNDYNLERRTMQKKLLREIERNLPDDPAPFLLVAGPEAEGWHRGIVGIVAARLRDGHHRPAAVLSVDGDSARGSVRSIPQVHAVRALDSAADLLTRYGGHAAAAGFTVPVANIQALGQRLSEAALEMVGGDMPLPSRRIDAQVDVEDLDMDLWKDLRRLAPHGKGNPEPRLMVRGATVREARVLKDAHLKIRLNEQRQLDVIWWRSAEHREAMTSGRPLELLGHLDVSVWNGRTRLQFTVEDARYA